MIVRTIPLSRLKPAPYNPRIELRPGNPVYDRLRQSIETFGIVEPIVWNKRTGFVVGGHQRLTVLADLGHRDAEVVVVNLSSEREKALNLALNKIQGGWDEPKLAALLRELGNLPEFDLDLTGFGRREVDELLARLPTTGGSLGDDASFDLGAELERKGPPVTQPGELLSLGHHRLLCGDSTKTEDVRQLMGKERAILFATDPPYLVGYDGTNHPGARGKTRASKNKDWSGSYGITWDDAEANPELYDRFIGVAVAEALRPNAAWYCWHASRRQAMVESAWQKHGAFVHCQLVWSKNRPVLTRTWYGWQHEPCFMGWLVGHKPPRVAKEILSTIWNADVIPNGPERPDHPTPKPVELFEIPMRQHTTPGEVCYEPFAGSGTQIVAAERLGRRCFAMEISPHYCDVIVRRWIHLVGEARAGRKLAARYRTSPRKEAFR